MIVWNVRNREWMENILLSWKFCFTDAQKRLIAENIRLAPAFYVWLDFLVYDSWRSIRDYPSIFLSNKDHYILSICYRPTLHKLHSSGRLVRWDPYSGIGRCGYIHSTNRTQQNRNFWHKVSCQHDGSIHCRKARWMGCFQEPKQTYASFYVPYYEEPCNKRRTKHHRNQCIGAVSETDCRSKLVSTL